jgi:hypothetical protein
VNNKDSAKKDPEEHVKKLKMDLAEKPTDKITNLADLASKNGDSIQEQPIVEVKSEPIVDESHENTVEIKKEEIPVEVKQEELSSTEPQQEQPQHEEPQHEEPKHEEHQQEELSNTELKQDELTKNEEPLSTGPNQEEVPKEEKVIENEIASGVPESQEEENVEIEIPNDYNGGAEVAN